MPIYEYRCQQCRRHISIFLRSFSDVRVAACDRCGSTSLTRLVSQVSVQKSWGESLSFPGSEALDSVDENDPEAMKGLMRRMRQEMGDDEAKLSELDLMDAGAFPHGPDEGLDDDFE
ncbi:MAG: zinc ribbon domain-containing protein [Chloroflexi bacterium]|nr:zinc ribbon domain-containing protein [Chloroflexota bacterium]